MKILLTLIALTISLGAFAQGRGGVDGAAGRGQGGGRGNQAMVPLSVVKEYLPATIVEDLESLNSVNLPLASVKEIKLTAEQKKKFAELSKELQAKSKELDREDLVAFREGFSVKVKAVLTADQVKIVDKFPAARGGGQGSGRGQRPGGPPPTN